MDIIAANNKPFSLFVCECKETFVSPKFIEEIEKEYSNYINIQYLKEDKNSAVFRNFLPGTIALIAQINNSERYIRTGFQKACVDNNGICVFASNIDNKYRDGLYIEYDETVIKERIISSFYWTIALCKGMNYDIIGDGYKLIDEFINNHNK